MIPAELYSQFDSALGMSATRTSQAAIITAMLTEIDPQLGRLRKFTEIAKTVGCSREWVRQIAFKRLRLTARQRETRDKKPSKPPTAGAITRLRRIELEKIGKGLCYACQEEKPLAEFTAKRPEGRFFSHCKACGLKRQHKLRDQRLGIDRVRIPERGQQVKDGLQRAAEARARGEMYKRTRLKRRSVPPGDAQSVNLPDLGGVRMPPFLARLYQCDAKTYGEMASKLGLKSVSIKSYVAALRGNLRTLGMMASARNYPELYLAVVEWRTRNRGKA